MSCTYLHRESCLTEELAVSVGEKSVIALVKKGFFPTPKQMPYAINHIFPITVAYKGPRFLGIFFFLKSNFMDFAVW